MSDLPNTTGIPDTTDIAAADRARLGTAGEADRRHTVACLFETRAAADRAAEDLVAAGIDRSAIDILDRSNEAATATEVEYEGEADGGGLWERIKHLFTGEDDTAGYYEGVHRGQILLTVLVRDETEANRVSAILERYDPVDIAAQEASWRDSGWRGDAPVDVAPLPSAKPAPRTGATSEPALAGRAVETRGGEQVIPVVEEKVAIGKRAVSGGRVRVHAFVVETPVEEDVRLCDEHVEVERRPADRPLEATDDVFRERDVEMTETREEAVVGKSARVTEEVVIRKQAGERTEHVSDTARRTEVKVNEDRTPTTRENTATPVTEPKPTTPAARRR